MEIDNTVEATKVRSPELEIGATSFKTETQELDSGAKTENLTIRFSRHERGYYCPTIFASKNVRFESKALVTEVFGSNHELGPGVFTSLFGSGAIPASTMSTKLQAEAVAVPFSITTKTFIVETI